MQAKGGDGQCPKGAVVEKMDALPFSQSIIAGSIALCIAVILVMYSRPMRIPLLF